MKGKCKELWARMRCGNIERAGNKGYERENCRMCRRGRENLEHIVLHCLKLKRKVKEDLLRKVEGGRQNEGNRCKWKHTMTRPIRMEVCEYIREFERWTSRTQNKQREEIDENGGEENGEIDDRSWVQNRRKTRARTDHVIKRKTLPTQCNNLYYKRIVKREISLNYYSKDGK